MQENLPKPPKSEAKKKEPKAPRFKSAHTVEVNGRTVEVAYATLRKGKR